MSPQIIVAIVLAVVLLALIGYAEFERQFGHYKTTARRKHS